MAEELNLSTLKPAQARRDRKRVGRGMGSGKGRYSGRGIKGQKSRSGSHKMRPGFEGGQNPLYMRLGKLRGPYSKDALPIGPHRTSTQPVNLRDLEERFDEGAEVTLEALIGKRLIKNMRVDVKVLAEGELTKKLTVTVHRFSAAAREKIEAAGGTAVALREPVKKKRRRAKAKAKPATPGPAAEAQAAPDEPEAATEEPAAEEEGTE